MDFFSSPQISLRQKKDVLKKVFESQIDQKFLSFLSLLLQKNLFKYIPEIFTQFRQLVHEKLGLMDVHLVTATPIDASVQEQLIHKLEHIYKKKMFLTQKIDPKLIGGGILTVADKMIDFSIRDKLNHLKQTLLN